MAGTLGRWWSMVASMPLVLEPLELATFFSAPPEVEWLSDSVESPPGETGSTGDMLRCPLDSRRAESV